MHWFSGPPPGAGCHPPTPAPLFCAALSSHVGFDRVAVTTGARAVRLGLSLSMDGASSPTPRLILASASPRRQSLLAEAGYAFTVEPADVNEADYPTALLPSGVAEHLAHSKALAVAERHLDDVVVLGADTVVAFGDMMLGKAVDAEDARRILTLLAGTTHLVITGIAVIRRSAGISLRTRELSAVRMRNLSAEAIDKYVATGDWEGKAGAYGIQDSDPFVSRLTGSHTNIVGLPMGVTKRLLDGAGIPTPHPMRPPLPAGGV
jgi:septum formation protein